MSTLTPDVETVERIIPAPAASIFAVLADPSRHHEIDGSGTVHEAKSGSQQLQLGSTFGMSMKAGLPYSMVSEVIEFEPDRRIAWQTRSPIRFLGKMVGGRIWRYELEPVDGVIVMVRPDAAEQVVREAIERGVPRVWLHRGVGTGAVSERAVELCRDAGVAVVDGACPLMFATPVGGVHRLHRLISHRRIAA